MALVESPGPSLQRSEASPGRFGDAINPGVPGLSLEQPSPVLCCHPCCSLGWVQRIYLLLQFQLQARPCAFPSLSPSTACTRSRGVRPAVTPEGTDEPCVAWQEGDPSQTLPLPQGRSGTIRVQEGRILHSHISHHPDFHTYNFSLSLPIQTLSFAF